MISLALLALLPHFCGAAESNLAIVQAGVQQSEDAPFVSSEYSFLPGDFIYFTFQVAGFGVQSNATDHVRKISLSYELAAVDSHGVPLAQPEAGVIETTLNPEDKTWTPKRRSLFLLPSFVAAGDFHIHLLVRDVIAKAEASGDFRFHIGGTKIQPAPSITIENFGFVRNETDREALALPAFRPGDTVYAHFDMAGYRTTGPQNEYHLSYGVTVLRPDGKTYLDQPHAAELKDGSFYPPQFVPGNLQITTSSDTTKGGYVVVLNVRDLTSNQTFQTKQSFTIE